MQDLSHGPMGGDAHYDVLARWGTVDLFEPVRRSRSEPHGTATLSPRLIRLLAVLCQVCAFAVRHIAYQGGFRCDKRASWPEVSASRFGAKASISRRHLQECAQCERVAFLSKCGELGVVGVSETVARIWSRSAHELSEHGQGRRDASCATPARSQGQLMPVPPERMPGLGESTGLVVCEGITNTCR